MEYKIKRSLSIFSLLWHAYPPFFGHNCGCIVAKLSDEDLGKACMNKDKKMHGKDEKITIPLLTHEGM
jgi:hypothetical protein